MTLRTTLRETLSSRQICLIGFCCTKNARRIFATVSTTNIPHEPPVQNTRGTLDDLSWGPVWKPITPKTGGLFHA